MKFPQNRRLIFLGLAIVLVLALAAVARGTLREIRVDDGRAPNRRLRRFPWPPRPRGWRTCP